MNLKFAGLCIFFLGNIRHSSNEEITMLTLIKSLKDAQELVDAYNDGDYIKAAVKLIDIQFIIDPPEKGSREEILMISLKKYLEKIYPQYQKIHKMVQNMPTDVEDLKNLKYEDVVDITINNLDKALFDMGLRYDNWEQSRKIINPKIQVIDIVDEPELKQDCY